MYSGHQNMLKIKKILGMYITYAYFTLVNMISKFRFMNLF